jgi:hypothetical protein
MYVEGLGVGQDFKLWPGGGRAWDWSETGTHHQPGIQPADIEELLAHGSRVVVLGRGVESRLQVCPTTEELLRQQAVEYHIEPTPAAVALYNKLADEGRPVGGLFHSTC